MKKRILSLLLILVLAITSLPISSFAAEDVSTYTDSTIVVESKAAKAGTTVDVDLLVVNNPGMAGAKITISYDEKLTLIDATSGETFEALDYTRPGVYTSPCNFNWDSENAEVTEDGILLTLTFQVSEDAVVNENLNIELSYRFGDIYNSDLDSLPFDMVSGCVSVIDYTPGDVNDDGVINGKDVTLIRRFNAGGYDVSINEAAADVNDDGVVNGKDVTLVRRFNAGGYDVELLPSTPKCDHTMQATEAKEATCTEDGNDAYWYCTKCEKYFSDESGTVEVQLADTVIEALGHNIVTVPGYDATKENTGLTDGKACDRTGCDYVEIEQEEIPVITGYAITYEIANGEGYIENNKPVIPADKMQYFKDTGLELPQPEVPGYRFIGWSYSQASSANIITEIPADTEGDKKLYGHWEPIVYTVTFDSPDVPVNGTKITGETILNATEYTVDKGKDLPVPKCFGYTFVGWSDDNGFIVNRIKVGTTGHMTLRANWTSDRNKATSYQNYGDPIIIEDDIRGQFLFVYNIGKIENVPLNEVEFIGKSEGLVYKKEVSVVDKVDENYIEEINLMISNATTKSSGWTLSKDWNDLYSIQDETGTMKGISDERTTTDGKTVGGKYFVSNSEGGSSYVSTESGSSSSSTSKITTEDSFGINGSYDNTEDKYCDTKLGVTNETDVNAGVKVKYGPAEASAGVKNTTTVSAEAASGRKDHTAVHVDSSVSSFVGTVNTQDASSYLNSAVSNSSNWNSVNSYESSDELFTEEAIKNSIEEQITEKTTLNLSKALGGSDSNSEELSEQNRTDNEYNTRFTYSKGTQTETKKYLEFTSSETGYYRIITAGTVHVFGVVGYDVATSSYFTYCYNVLDDTTREIMDYSKDNMNFDDCQNGVVTFDIPYEVNEYIAGVMGKTDGLETDYSGRVNDFIPSDDFLSTETVGPDGEVVVNEGFNGTVVIPQYVSKDNEDGSYSAVKVTSLSAKAFDRVRDDVRVVVLPIYITEIPDGAFANCTNLETVIAYGVTSIGDNAFANCTSLKKFYVDNKITHLGDNAFENVPEVAIMASSSLVADAAINCGAKNITLNLSCITDTYENKVIEVGTDTESFTLIGNGSVYNNIEIDSQATKMTMISNMIFANNRKTPLKLASETVTLARVTVEDSPSFAMIINHDNVNVKLLGTVTLNSTTENAVLSKSVILSQLQQSTTSELVVNGKYLVCGEVTNSNYLNVEPTIITDITEFENYLNSCNITFDANGGSVAQHTMTVYRNNPYGELPVPERQYYAFDGWYTEAEGGSLITAETIVDTVVNHKLYAHWTPITATIVFDANGGQVSQESKLVYVGEKVGELPTPTRTHYIFKGWYTTSTGGEQITENTVLQEAGAKTIYAQWDMQPYNATWGPGTGYSITVNRTSSPNAGAATGNISSGTTVYYGDVLSVTYTASTGHTIISTGSTSITVTGNVTSSNIYATAIVNSYTASWSAGEGYNITVNRTSSPNAGATIGNISNGEIVYYGDVLSVTYTASTGYSISSQGSTSITVTGNVTSSNIYATATLNSYTYNIVYESINGTALGTTSATYEYGTTNTIYPPEISGYYTPASQSVAWDSTGAKTIKFTYYPIEVATSQYLWNGWWWWSGTSDYGVCYDVHAEYQNRTADSVQIRLVWKQAINKAQYGFTQQFYASFWHNGTQRANTGDVTIATASLWPKNGSWHTGSTTAYSNWITVSLDTTNATTVVVNCDWWSSEDRGSWADKVLSIPAY